MKARVIVTGLLVLLLAVAWMMLSIFVPNPVTAAILPAKTQRKDVPLSGI